MAGLPENDFLADDWFGAGRIRPLTAEDYESVAAAMRRGGVASRRRHGRRHPGYRSAPSPEITDPAISTHLSVRAFNKILREAGVDPTTRTGRCVICRQRYYSDYPHDCPGPGRRAEIALARRVAIDLPVVSSAITTGVDGHDVIIDVCDVELLSVFSWHAYVTAYRVYLRTSTYIPGEGSVHFGLHQLIAGTIRGLAVHHINSQTLDNRRCNLQVLTAAEHSKVHMTLNEIRRKASKA